MSKRDPRRFAFLFDAKTEPFETDLLRIFLTREGARCVRGCIDIELAAGDETVTVVVPGRLEDIGPRRRKKQPVINQQREDVADDTP